MLRNSTFSFLVVIFLVGCGDNSLHAEAEWQIRCRPHQGGCVPGASRTILGQNGDDGLELECAVRDSSDGSSRRLAFQIVQGGNRFAVNNLLFNDSGPLGGGCQLQVREDRVLYQGSCGTSAPTDDLPCQIATLTIDHNAFAGPTISGTVQCRGITSTVGTQFVRDLTFPSDPNAPARFEFVNCDGL